jgi:hypothetical protein
MTPEDVAQNQERIRQFVLGQARLVSYFNLERAVLFSFD